jgi:hypothetical protein
MALLCVLSPVLFGCGMEKEKAILMAAGSYADLAVVLSDDGLRPLADRYLPLLNDEVTFVIQTEPRFLVDIYQADKWQLAKGYKNCLFLLHLGQDSAPEKAIRSLIPKEKWAELQSGRGGIVQVPDPWASYQLLVVVASADRNTLGSILRQGAPQIRDLIERDSHRRILRRNRYDGLQTDLMDAYWKRFGFYLEIPAAFRQNQVLEGELSAVELMQNGPSQGISICWQDVPDPQAAMGDRQALLALRERMGRRLHSEELVPESLAWTEAEIGGRPCVKLTGAWTGQTFAGGGPFWSYFIPDVPRSRMFCLDLLVYAPGEDKMAMFRRLDAVAGTFSTTGPQP